MPSLTPEEWKPKFIAHFAETGNITKSAEAVGINRETIRKHEKKDAEFAEAFKDARRAAVYKLEDEAWRRAHDGVNEPKYYKDELVGYVRKYSDSLIMFLLKAHAPELYGERQIGDDVAQDNNKVVFLPPRGSKPDQESG